VAGDPPFSTPFAAVVGTVLPALRAAFGPSVRAVELMPAVVTAAELNRLATSAPGVYLSFGAGPRDQRPELTLLGGWTVSLIASHAGAAAGRLTGDALGLGLFEMAAVAAVTLEGLRVPRCGSIEVRGIEVIEAAQLLTLGVAVWAITVQVPMSFGEVIPKELIPRLPGGGTGPAGTLGTGSFKTLHTDFDLPPVPPGRPVLDDADADAVGQLQLPGA